MKRSIKNIIMTGMAIVMIGTSAITCSYAGIQSHSGNMTPPAFSQQENGQGQFGPSQGGMQGKNDNNSSKQMPEMNGNGSDSNNSQQPPEMNGNGSDSNNSQQPPEMNGNGSDSNNSQQPPEMNGNSSDSNNSQQPPEMDGNTSGSDNSQSDSKSSNTSTDNTAAVTQTSLDTSEAKMSPVMNKNNSGIAALCYIFLAVQLAILLMIIAYLIISKGNKLSFNEVFKK